MTALDVVLSITRVWTRLYTWRLPLDVAAERCAEIESDVYEMQHDESRPRGARGAGLALVRLIEGLTDDLAWRLEQATTEEQLIVRRLVAIVAAGAAVIGLWTIPLIYAGGMQRVSACADRAPAPEATVDYRVELIRCTGAFFQNPNPK